LSFEACEDAVNDGIHLLELRYAPTFITSGHPSLNFEKIHQAFLRGTERAKKKWSIKTGLICIIQRTLNIKTAEQVTDFAIENTGSFVGLDLADNEDGFEPKVFAKLFAKAKTAGLSITVHSGESPSKNAGQWIKDSIEILGAERIGHGVQAIHFPDVIKILIDKKIPLEVCPYSNWLTQAFPNHALHPLKKLKDLGVLVTLNSDDPGMFASTLSDDYLIAQNEIGFTQQDFKDCYQTAVEKTFIK
jgi:adenosine deaminase